MPSDTTPQNVSHHACTNRQAHVITLALLHPSHAAPTYHSPLFLDCCGLVRRVLRDLKEEFGFSIGPWNQAYQVSSS